jgi:hypothetical protein
MTKSNRRTNRAAMQRLLIRGTAVAAAVGAVIATAPAASATPPGQLQTQCAVLGGDWTPVEGVGYVCCYKPLAGDAKQTCDSYDLEGNFLGSQDDTKPILGHPPSGARPTNINPGAGTLPGPTTTTAAPTVNRPGAGTLQ